LKRTGFSEESRRKSYEKMMQKKKASFNKKIPKRKKKTKVKTPKMSQDAKEKNKQYKALRKGFLQAHPRCQFVDGEGIRCDNHATDVHHKAGRAKFHLRIDTWMAVCRDCHSNKIHGDPEYAYQAGFLVNALKLMRKEELESFEENGNFLKQ